MSLKDTIARLFGPSTPAGGDTADVPGEALPSDSVDGDASADASASQPRPKGDAEPAVAEPDSVAAEASATEDDA